MQERGLNVAGQLSYSTSISIVARGMMHAMKSVNIPISTIPFKFNNSDQFIPYKNEGYRYPVTFLPNWFFQTKDDDLKYQFRKNSNYVIAYWFWECRNYIHSSFDDAIPYVDEIWVPTEYLKTVFQEHTNKPVIKVPYSHKIANPLWSMESSWTTDSSIRTQMFPKHSVEDDDFVFFFTCDLASTPLRKNPYGVIEAFKKAFNKDDKVKLIIKTVKWHCNPRDTIQNMLSAIDHHPGIIWIHEEVPDWKLMMMIANSDCYVSLHRSEGLGLGMLESMMLGTPVIATAYGGNMEFMNENNSLLVNYSMVRNDQDVVFFNDQCIWAEPDLDHAVKQMRYAYNNQEKVKLLGLKGRACVDLFTPELSGSCIRDRLNQIYERLL